MEDEIVGDIPCSSLAVDSVLRVGTAGGLWGLCTGPYDAKKLGIGINGVARAVYVAKSAGGYGFQCGLFAAVFSSTRCGVQRYRGRNDWVNALIAGGLAGAAVGAGTRNWKHVAGMASVISASCAVVGDSRSY